MRLSTAKASAAVLACLAIVALGLHLPQMGIAFLLYWAFRRLSLGVSAASGLTGLAVATGTFGVQLYWGRPLNRFLFLEFASLALITSAGCVLARSIVLGLRRTDEPVASDPHAGDAVLRVIFDAFFFGFFCVLVLAVASAVGGYLYGAGANHQYQPGFEGAVMNTWLMTFFFGLPAWAIGAIAGAVAGLVGIGIDRLRGKW